MTNKKLEWIDTRKKKKFLAVGTGIGALTLIVMFFAGILPTLAGYLFLIMANLWWMVCLAFSSLSGWFLASSDQSFEKAIWAGVFIVLVGVISYWAGVSIATSYIFWIFVIFFGLIGILAFALGRKKNRK